MDKIELFIEDELDVYNEEYIKDDLSNLDIKNKTFSINDILSIGFEI